MENLSIEALLEIRDLLETKYHQFNQPHFIEHDPIQIPHRFSKKQDIEIMALLMATIAWGNRKMIINNGLKLLEIMENAPYDFVVNYESGDLAHHHFVHRTFNREDLDFFLRGLKRCYKNNSSLESWFDGREDAINCKSHLLHFRSKLMETAHAPRSEKHVSNPDKGSAAKRLNMFLRWMVRRDKNGVDFGLWNSISPAQLCLPLDVHTGRVARSMGLLRRKQNDWKAVEEMMQALRLFDPKDPVKYDYALFGLGVFESASFR
ncbi:MAG: TIGR02757 family protein [Bacteroidota bacterium]